MFIFFLNSREMPSFSDIMIAAFYIFLALVKRDACFHWLFSSLFSHEIERNTRNASLSFLEIAEISKNRKIYMIRYI